MMRVRLHTFCIYEILKWDANTTTQNLQFFVFLRVLASRLRLTVSHWRRFVCLLFFSLLINFYIFTLPLDSSLDLSMSGNTQMVMHGWAISAFDYDFDGQQRTDVVIITRMASKRNTTTT